MSEIINKLLAKIETDMAEGNISRKEGDKLIRYMMQVTAEDGNENNA